jgi:hypothetical protein
LKLVQKKAGNALEAIGIGKDSLSRTQTAQQLREKIEKWDSMKLKCFYTTEKMVSKLKTHKKWEKIFASYTSTDNQNIQEAQKTKFAKTQ